MITGEPQIHTPPNSPLCKLTLSVVHYPQSLANTTARPPPLSSPDVSDSCCCNFASTGSVLLALCIHSISVFCSSPSLAHVSCVQRHHVLIIRHNGGHKDTCANVDIKYPAVVSGLFASDNVALLKLIYRLHTGHRSLSFAQTLNYYSVIGIKCSFCISIGSRYLTCC